MGGVLTLSTAVRVIAPGPLPGHRVLSTTLHNEGDEPLTLDARDLVIRAADGSPIPATTAFDRRRSTAGSVSPKHALVAPGQKVAVVMAWRAGDGPEAVVLEHPFGDVELESL